MQLKFTKMQGLGNDFVLIDLVSQRCNLRPSHVRRFADRRLGIGCDQVLVVEPPRDPDVDFRYRIFNADGREVEQCGNGARCVARFVRDRRLTARQHIILETAGGRLELQLRKDRQVEVNMGPPRLDPAQVPFLAEQRAALYTLDVDGDRIDIAAVSMGNPHAVLLVDDVAKAPVESLGPLLQQHEKFPQQVNVGFMERLSRREIRLRVFERGVGETLACGTGACAAVVSGRLQDLLDERVTVHLKGGDLEIAWAGENHPVMMTGPATTVFEGSVRI